MRKNWLLLLTIFFSLGVGFTSCGDDDDDPIVEETVFGAYKGTMDIDVEGAGFPGMDGIKAKVNLADAGQNKVKFLLKDFSFGDLELGDIVVQSADIRNTGSQHEISGIEKGLKLQKIGTCDVNITGTVVGEQITLNITVDVDDTVFEGGLKVGVKFNGTKMATDQSSEAEILAFEFDPEVAEANKLVTKVEQKDKNFYLTVSDAATEEDLKKLIPTITVSDKATLSPESGKVQDFSKSVVYTVKSEDGIKENKYTVSIASVATFFDFEEWEIEKEVEGVKLYSPAPKSFWGTSNHGAMMATSFAGIDMAFAVTQSSKEDAAVGNSAAKIETLDTVGKDLWLSKIPKITSGSLFSGIFNVEISNPLKSTKFGVPVDKKPISVKGFYKYKSGEKYFVCDDPVKNMHLAKEDPNLANKDEFSIGAYLYEYDPKIAESDTKYTTYLTGFDIKTSDKIIAKAELSGGNQADYKEFVLDLDYSKEYDKEKSYRLAVVISSSKDGDKFSGAPGSVLFIDNVEIINEK